MELIALVEGGRHANKQKKKKKKFSKAEFNQRKMYRAWYMNTHTKRACNSIFGGKA